MAGETNLQTLLQAMEPNLLDEEYIFMSIENAKYGDRADLTPFAIVMEEEAMTMVIAKLTADKNGIEYDAVFRCITLAVHSNLEAVGLTAAVSTKLAGCGISANVIAGYFHDHIFVQSEYAEQAMAALGEFDH